MFMTALDDERCIAPRVAVHGLNLESIFPRSLSALSLSLFVSPLRMTRIIKHLSMIVCLGILSSTGVDRSW